FHISHSFEAFARPQVPDSRLEQFAHDPTRYGPKLRNTWMDKRAIDTKTMLSLCWNQALIAKLAAEAENIVQNTEDERFGSDAVDWKGLFRERLSKVALDVVTARPQEGET
ncbi:hypothetical protein K435DRAFT_612143, partial [Dendrothele bispora CBS 962.96]